MNTAVSPSPYLPLFRVPATATLLTGRLRAKGRKPLSTIFFKALSRTLFVGYTLVALTAPLTASAEDKQKKLEHHFVGVAGCASSNCHGGVSPRKSSPVLQNEYTTWFKRDKHSRAWKTLLSPESKRIAMQLGIADASKDRTCLQCHSTLAPEGVKTGEKFRAEDGVGCESCHGAAGEWIRTHTASGTTHHNNIAQGLTPIDRPQERARICLSCHMGDEERPFTHTLYGAGHPRLSFELDTYSVIQPAHWLNDADYRERKGENSSLVIWLAGQRAAAQRTVQVLRSIPSHQGSLFPELSAFTCSSCHHDLSHRQYLTRNYQQRPGQPRLNLTPLEMLAATVQAAAPERSEKLLESIAALGSGSPLAPMLDSLDSQVKELGADTLASSVSADAPAVLKSLLQFGSSHPSLYYETAEQLAMGAASAQAQIRNAGPRPAALEKLFKVLQSYDDFTPEQFSEACQQYLKSLNR